MNLVSWVTAPLDQLIDVHACAKYKTDKFGEFGAWHCVIDINLAQEMRRQGIEADGKTVGILQNNCCEMFLSGISTHSTICPPTYNILWLMLRQIRKFPMDLKHKQPLAKDLSGFWLLNQIFMRIIM